MPRFHRWSYWCITSRAGALTLLLADVGYVGVALVSFLDLDAGRTVERIYLRPGGLPIDLPGDPGADLALDVARLRLSLRARGETLHIDGQARTLLGRRIAIDLEVARPRAHETLNVVVPWDATRYHLTSKQQALPARGTVRVDGVAHRFGPADDGFACLDFGRGRWPRGIAWRWAFGAATRGGRTLGINLGAGWTDGTGVTENGIVVDGRVHKIASRVEFIEDRRAWSIRGLGVDLRFQPRHERRVRLPLVALHQLNGRFHGTVLDWTIDDMPGQAESLRARW